MSVLSPWVLTEGQPSFCLIFPVCRFFLTLQCNRWRETRSDWGVRLPDSVTLQLCDRGLVTQSLLSLLPHLQDGDDNSTYLTRLLQGTSYEECYRQSNRKYYRIIITIITFSFLSSLFLSTNIYVIFTRCRQSKTLFSKEGQRKKYTRNQKPPVWDLERLDSGPIISANLFMAFFFTINSKILLAILTNRE